MKKLFVALFVICMLFTAKAQAANIITNGSFEIEPEKVNTATGYDNYVTGSTDIPGWTVTSGDVDYISTYWKSADGDRSIDLSGYTNGSISQSFAITKNKLYNVKFSFAGNPGSSDVAMIVSVAGQSQRFDFNTAGKTTDNMGWIEKEFTFKANNSETTTLTFASLNDSCCGPALDKVSVEEAPVPEPSTMFLGFLGASGLLGIRRRKNN